MLKTTIFDISSLLMQDGVISKESVDYRLQLSEHVKELELSDVHKKVLVEALALALIPNKTFNPEKTKKFKIEAHNKISAIKTRFREGQPIVYAKEVVTHEHIEIFKATNIYGSRFRLKNLISSLIFSGVIIFLFLIFLNYFNYKLLKQFRILTLLTGLTIFTLVAARFIEPISGFLVPLPLNALLVAVLINPIVAMGFSTALGFLIGIIFNFNYILLIVLTFGCYFSILYSARLTQRSDLTFAGVATGLFQIFLVVMMHLLLPQFNFSEAIKEMSFVFIGGFLSAITAMGVLPYLEVLTESVTAIKLLELSSPTQPALQKLMIQAPGTYHHSLLVANLASRAAEAIGADVLLTRVSAYYHDLGKAKRPLLFIENLKGQANPHDKLDVAQSTKIILSHPKDGVELGKKYLLPKPILNMMIEHHGTSVLSYFYLQAVSKNQNGPINKDNFRYQCRKPQSKEAAVLMLADASEAAVRSLKSDSLNKAEEMVEKIVQEKLLDGQFAECNITLADLTKIKNAIIEEFKHMYHDRVEYSVNNQK